jgi:hypothetical protein
MYTEREVIKMIRQINFDMDGTIANLYGENNWLDDIIHERVNPYVNAKPLINMNSLARVLNRLIRNGYEVNIISWTAKNGTNEYNERIAAAKREWIAKHLNSVHFNNVYVIPYGTPKENYGFDILFDDEENNRNNWNGTAYDEKNIIEILKQLT